MDFVTTLMRKWCYDSDQGKLYLQLLVRNQAQGSIPGQLLFNIFLEDLLFILSNVDIDSYSDAEKIIQSLIPVV